MNATYFMKVCGLLAPEVLLSGVAFIVLLADMLPSFCGSSRQTVESRHQTLGRIVLLGLAGVGLMYLVQLIVPCSIKHAGSPTIILGNGAFVLSPLNSVFKLVVVVLAFVTILIGIETPYSHHVGEYYGLMLFSVLGMLFLVSSEDLLMIFVSLELISLALYALTAFQKGARRSVEAGLKYFIFGGLSAAFLLFGLSYIYGATGHTSLKEIAAFLNGGHSAPVPVRMLNLGILFTLVGLGFKIAAAPFHLWAPDAYEGAPTPVAALIATGSKVASFVALTKLLLGGLTGAAGSALAWPSQWQSGWTITVAIIAVASMALGNIAAIAQRNVKRLLAYSSVAHAGYILVAMVAVNSAGIPSEESAPAIYFYVFIYALTNVGAFGVVNAMASKAGGDDFEHFSGMSQRAPFLSLLMLVFVLSLAGIPPLAGFFGKFYLFAAAVQVDPKNLGLLWLVAFAIMMSAVSLYYYLKLAKQMYVLPARDLRQVGSCPATRITLGLVCLMVLLLGIFPARMVDVFKRFHDHDRLGPAAGVSHSVNARMEKAAPL